MFSVNLSGSRETLLSDHRQRLGVLNSPPHAFLSLKKINSGSVKGVKRTTNITFLKNNF